ncbi:MAG: DUF2793 domain-containing protein [Gammaproteobacteria bacterium]|nr:DUF2793 domain-containing protein [Gammaproteobacteria bacterium]
MSTTEPRSGLKYAWDPDTENFSAEMDTNLLFIGRVGLNLSIIDRDLTAPPGTPSDGDGYIVGASATGDWATHDDDVAIWDDDGSDWVFYTPSEGWLAYLEDEQKLTVFKAATGWSSGVAI